MSASTRFKPNEGDWICSDSKYDEIRRFFTFASFTCLVLLVESEHMFVIDVFYLASMAGFQFSATTTRSTRFFSFFKRGKKGRGSRSEKDVHIALQ